MRAAIVVVDMVKDTLDGTRGYPITPHARAMAPKIDELNRHARERGWPVVFACDSFLADDFLFSGKLEPHSLRDTPGSRPTDALEWREGDTYLPKRRFSAFFKTDLDQTLRTWRVDTVIVCGVATNICVLTTALDAVCHDFRAVMVEDASAAPTPEIHARTLDLYRKGPLFPLLRVMSVDQVLALDE